MTGMHTQTGKKIGGLAHIRQSIADILTTPLGSRVMRRDYGSLLFELIDQPENGATQVRLFAATAQALLKWEPRIQIKQITITRTSTAGKVILSLNAVRLFNGAEIDLSLPLLMNGGA